MGTSTPGGCGDDSGGHRSPCPAGLTLQARQQEAASFQGLASADRLPSPLVVTQAAAWAPAVGGSLVGRRQHLRNGLVRRPGGTAHRFLEADAGAFGRLQVRPGVFSAPCRGASTGSVAAGHGPLASIRGTALVAPCAPCHRPVTPQRYGMRPCLCQAHWPFGASAPIRLPNCDRLVTCEPIG